MRRGHSRDSSDRIGNGLGRATIEGADDTHLLQEVRVKLFHGEQQEAIEHAQPYGFSFVPKKPTMEKGIRRAAEAFVGFLFGNRSHGVATVVSDRRYRPNNLQEGETVHHDDQGLQVYHSRNGMVIHAPAGKFVHVQTADGAHLLMNAGKVRMQLGAQSVTIKDNKIFLGKEDVKHAVLTVDGPSTKVFAVLDETEGSLAAEPIAKRTEPGSGS